MNVVREMNNALAANRKDARKSKPIGNENPVEGRREKNVKRAKSSGWSSGENNKSSGVNQINTVYIGNSNLKRIAASFIDNKHKLLIINCLVFRSICGERVMVQFRHTLVSKCTYL